MPAPQSSERSLADLELDLRAFLAGQSPLFREAGQFVFAFLQDSSDSIEMAVDGSVTPVTFNYTPGADVLIERMNLQAVDDAMEVPDGFFTLVALTNGVLIQVLRDGLPIQHFGTDVAPVKCHAEFANLAGVDSVSDTVANSSRFGIRWTIAHAGTQLRMNSDDVLQITIRDDLSALTEFRAQVQGYVP